MRPQFCGHVHKSEDITQIQTSSAKLQSCIRVKILALAASYGILFSVMAQKMQMENACTYTCIFEWITSCSIAHISTTHRSTNMCRRYIKIYMTVVNVHQSNLRNNGVLKLLQDKNQLLIKTQTCTLVIVPTYSLTNPQTFLNTAFFSQITVVHILKEYIKMFFIEWKVSR